MEKKANKVNGKANANPNPSIPIESWIAPPWEVIVPTSKVPKIGPDGKVIVPSLSYWDIGGMGDNANKSFWTNVPNSNSFISFDLVFSSYKGEMLMDFLTDYDVDFRKIVYEQISKTSFEKLQGSEGKNKLLEDIKNEFNSYLDEKKLDPIIFGVHYKKFAITTRGN